MHRSKLMDVYNFLVDGCASRLRFLFLPFYMSRQIFSVFLWVYYFGVNEYLKARCGACGRGVRFNGRVSVSKPAKMRIGDNVHINDGAYIRTEGGVEIGSNVHISRNFTLYSRNHRYRGDLLPYDSVNEGKPVWIGDNVWIGMNVSIAPGVKIGEGAIIGMGVVLTRDVDPFAILVPVKPVKIGEREAEHYYNLAKNGCVGGASGYINRHL